MFGVKRPKPISTVCTIPSEDFGPLAQQIGLALGVKQLLSYFYVTFVETLSCF